MEKRHSCSVLRRYRTDRFWNDQLARVQPALDASREDRNRMQTLVQMNDLTVPDHDTAAELERRAEIERAFLAGGHPDLPQRFTGTLSTSVGRGKGLDPTSLSPRERYPSLYVEGGELIQGLPMVAVGFRPCDPSAVQRIRVAVAVRRATKSYALRLKGSRPRKFPPMAMIAAELGYSRTTLFRRLSKEPLLGRDIHIALGALRETGVLNLNRDRNSDEADMALEQLFEWRGLAATTKVEKGSIGETTIFRVGGKLLAHLKEEPLTPTLIQAMIETAPEEIVLLEENFLGDRFFRDRSLQILKERGIVVTFFAPPD